MSPEKHENKSSIEKDKNIAEASNIAVIDVTEQNDYTNNEVSFEEALNVIGKGWKHLFCAF